MSDLDKKRDFVSGLYPSPGWKERVRKMRDGQVVAIYLREISKAQKPPKPKPKPPKTEKESKPDDDIPF